MPSASFCGIRFFEPAPLPCAGGFGLPGALGRMPRRPWEPTTCVGCSSFCMNDGCCPIPALVKLGKPLMEPVTPPGGIGRRLGKPAAELTGGIEVAVDAGYIIDCDMA